MAELLRSLVRRDCVVLQQGVMKEHARLAPIALDRSIRDPAQLGDLDETEAAEEMKVDELGERRLERGQLIEGVAESLQLVHLFHGRTR